MQLWMEITMDDEGPSGNNVPSVSPSAGWQSSKLQAADMHFFAPETDSIDGYGTPNSAVMPPLDSSYTSGASPQRLGSGLLLTRGNCSWSTCMDHTMNFRSMMGSLVGASASSGVLAALQQAGAAAADLATSHCLAQFSSDPGFAERAAKFSSFSSSNGNTYNSQTPYALGPDGVKPARGSRSIIASDAGGDNVVDGKLSRSSSCSRLAKLAPSSIITSARRTSHGAGSSSVVQSKSPDAAGRREMVESKSPVMQRDDMKMKKSLQTIGMSGREDMSPHAAAAMETFEAGATEIGRRRGVNDTTDDEAADHGFRHSSAAGSSQQACGDRDACITGKRKHLVIQQTDELLYCKETAGGRNAAAQVDSSCANKNMICNS
jgi:hypothetical protein